jgi:hypothetical protein
MDSPLNKSQTMYSLALIPVNSVMLTGLDAGSGYLSPGLSRRSCSMGSKA